MNSVNGCNDAEKTFIKKINKMTDAQLKKEFSKRNRQAIEMFDDSEWHIAYRKELFVGWELMERGFHKEEVWVK